MNIKQAAIEMIELGFVVVALGENRLPLGSWGADTRAKIAGGETRGDIYPILYSREDVERFYEARGDQWAFIAALTGHESNLLVIDADKGHKDRDGKDQPDGEEVLRKWYGDMIPTPVSYRTKRGGIHFYFRHPS